MRRRPSFWAALLALALALASSLGCRTAPAAPAQTLPLSLYWASTEYYVAGSTDPVVELRIIVDNAGRSATDSTSILWEPSFAQQFTFLGSDPAPWRVRIDENGWGTLDTSGVLPGQFGTFRLWFAANTYRVQEPQVIVVANGRLVVAQTTAGATHLRRERAAAAQQTFERGAPAAAADAVGFLPAESRGAFPLAVSMALLLALVAGAGGAAAFCMTARRL